MGPLQWDTPRISRGMGAEGAARISNDYKEDLPPKVFLLPSRVPRWRTNMETLSLQDIEPEVKVALLRELGFETDGEFVLNRDGSRYRDPYINCAVRVDNMLVLTGSTIIIDDNPVSIDCYLDDHPGAL